MKSPSAWASPFVWLLLAVVAMAVRLPHLLNPAGYVDGDEAKWLLIARHMAQGQGWTLYCYGTSFPMALVEPPLVVLATTLLGDSFWVVSLTMFSLWLAGLLVLFHALVRLTDRRSALLTSVLLAVAPAWIKMSTAFWGYNLAAFFFHSVALLALSRLLNRNSDADRRLGFWAILGLFGGLTFVSQLIHAIGLAVMTITLWPRLPHRLRGTLTAAAAAMIPLALVAMTRPRGLPGNAHLFDQVDLIAALRNLWTTLQVAWSGAWFLDRALPAGAMVSAAGFTWVVAALLLVALAIQEWLRHRQSHLGISAALAALAIIGFALVAGSNFGYRYLVPAITYLAILAASQWHRLASRPASAIRLPGAAIGVLLAVSIAACIGLGRVSFSGSRFGGVFERQAIAELIQTLEQRQVRHVYTTGAMFQWKLMAASHEAIIARWRDPQDRYPAYPLAVDHALHTGRPVALVHEDHSPHVLEALARKHGMTAPPSEVIAGRYVVMFNPPAAYLRLWFELNPPTDPSASPAPSAR